MRETSKSEISIGGFLSFATIFIKLIIGIIFTPIIIKNLGQSQYGVYSLCISFIGYLTIFNSGVNAAYVRFYVQEKTVNSHELGKINGLFLKLFTGLSAISLTVGILLSHNATLIFGNRITVNEYELLEKCFLILAVCVTAEILNCYFGSMIIANERFIFGKTVNIVTTIMVPIIAIPMLKNGFDCSAVILARCLAAIVTLLFNYFYCKYIIVYSIDLKKNESVLIKAIFQFVGFIFLQSVMDQLNWQIDKFILARVKGTDEVSVYSVGATFNTYYITIASCISGVFIAQINKAVAVKDTNRLNELFLKTSKAFTCIVGYVFLAYSIFGRKFIVRWAGSDYADSFFIGWLLMFPVTFSLAFGIGQDVARAKNKHQLQIVINLCLCVANACVSIPLAKFWGAFGSALGTFFCELIICCIVQPIYYKTALELDVYKGINNVLKYLPGVMIPSIIGYILNHYFVKAEYKSLVFYGLLFTVLYVVSVYTIYLDTEEKIQIKKELYSLTFMGRSRC